MREGLSHQGILLDTSFLIRLTNEKDPLHLIAKAYFDAAVKEKIPMHLSALVLAEFELNQNLPVALRFAMIPATFDMLDGKRAAQFQKAIGKNDPGDDRGNLKVDTMLMAQTQQRKLGAILTNDKSTLDKYLGRLREVKLTEVQAILLSEGFEPERLKKPAQRNLQMPLAGA